MASIQEKIKKKNQKIKRVLFDNNIRVMGETVNALAIQSQADPDFPDDETLTIFNKKNIEVILDIPGDVFDLNIMQGGEYSTPLEPEQNNFYLYDVLPIELYTKFDDDLQVGDLLVYKVYNKVNNPTPVILRLTQKQGVFTKYSTWERFLVSFHHLDLTSEVKQLISEYMNDETI